jgi:hypothetical protein
MKKWQKFKSTYIYDKNGTEGFPAKHKWLNWVVPIISSVLTVIIINLLFYVNK